MSSAVRGALAVATAQPVMFAGQMLIGIVLARLLTPSDVGLVAMVTAVTNFALIFRDFGLGTVAIQRHDLTDTQASNLFWLNVAIGGALTVATMLLAWPLSRLYSDPRIFAITCAVSFSFVASGLAVQHSAMLRRALRFGTVAKIDIASLVAAGAIAIAVAVITQSYWALVVLSVGRQVFLMIGAWLATEWRPMLFTRSSGTRSLLTSGLDIAGFDLVNYWSRNLDNVLIGRILGAGPLGYYQKAYELLLLPINQLRGPLAAVALPALSRLHAAPQRAAEVFTDLIGTSALLTSGAVAALLTVVDVAVPMLLGDQWAPIVPLFKLLGPAAAIQGVAGLLGLLLVTLGMTRRYFKWGVLHAFLMVTSFVVGIRWGIEGLIISYVIANALALPPSIIFCTRGTAVSARKLSGAIAVPFLVCGSGFLGASATRASLQALGVSPMISAAAGVTTLATVVGVHLFAAPARYLALRRVWEHVQSRLPRRILTPAHTDD